jgi:hypothetical protein
MDREESARGTAADNGNCAPLFQNTPFTRPAMFHLRSFPGRRRALNALFERAQWLFCRGISARN